MAKKKAVKTVKKTEPFDIELVITVLFMLCVYTIMYCLIGKYPWTQNPYNSYVLQSVSWLEGRLDLGRNYSHLEIAEYGDKFFVSFPPFPSILYLPFCLVFGEGFRDGFLTLLSGILGGVYTLKLARTFGARDMADVFWSLFVCCASNLLMLTLTPWVWFAAQNYAYTLTVAAIYYAVKKKCGLSLFLWACAVGCRPFQVFYLPPIAMLLLKDSEEPVLAYLKKNIKCFIPMAAVAAVYMLLNYLRFGNILEFGHNYLPEFVQAENGQFHISYLAENLLSLLRLPEIKGGSLIIPKFNGMNIFIVSPIFIPCILLPIVQLVKKGAPDWKNLIIPIMLVSELVAICMHRTMGGWHFGHRYPTDLIPLAFLWLMLTDYDKNSLAKKCVPLFVFGLAVEMVGSYLMFTNRL